MNNDKITANITKEEYLNMKDFNITIGNVTASTDMIEEDVVRIGMGLQPKAQDGKALQRISKCNVRHIRCNMDDFYADRHRFRFNYNGKEYVVPCYGAVDVVLDEISNEVPENVLLEVQEAIFKKIDKDEKNWRYPQEVYDMADEYAREWEK